MAYSINKYICIILFLINFWIKASDIDFRDKHFEVLKECQEKGLYPPNVKMTIISEPAETIVFPLRFEGCTEDSNLDGDLMLPLGENVISCIKINLPCGTLILIPCVCRVDHQNPDGFYKTAHNFRA